MKWDGVKDGIGEGNMNGGKGKESGREKGEGKERVLGQRKGRLGMGNEREGFGGRTSAPTSKSWLRHCCLYCNVAIILSPVCKLATENQLSTVTL